MKQTQQVTMHSGVPPQVTRHSGVPPQVTRQATTQATTQQRRAVQSTAAILAQGVTLDQLQEAVKRLRPLVEQFK